MLHPMGRTSAAEKTEIGAGEPIHIGDRALDNLAFIRETMERSTSFTAVPGYGGILMGITAIIAAFIASTQELRQDRLITWFAEAGIAFAIGVLGMWYKSRIGDTSLFSAPALKFARAFSPPLIAGVIITLGMWRFDHLETMIPVWIVSYGAAVVSGGSYSVKIVPIMGWVFILLGAAAFALPAGYGNIYMGATFGVVHIIFGAVIAKRYGG
jgi:hypothetical protein